MDESDSKGNRLIKTKERRDKMRKFVVVLAVIALVILTGCEAGNKELDSKYSVISFGTYPQTASGADSTPIEWLVLETDGQKALLISRYGLDAKPYNTEYTDTTWEKCSLRAWLNEEFINKAFSTSEQAAILTTTVDNSSAQGYSKWNGDGGKTTQDKIFLLSYAEANKYFGVTVNNENNLKARVSPTAYAKANGASISSDLLTEDGTGAGCWWLRSPYEYPRCAAIVYDNGMLYKMVVHAAYLTVRPALWVNLESEIFQSEGQ